MFSVHICVAYCLHFYCVSCAFVMSLKDLLTYLLEGCEMLRVGDSTMHIHSGLDGGPAPKAITDRLDNPGSRTINS